MPPSKVTRCAAGSIIATVTPLRNSIPRVARANASDAARWKQVTALIGSGYDAMGWIPEGQRSGAMSYTTQNMSAPYITLGEEDYLTFEAESAGEGFEDLNATVSMRLLQKTMRKEETGLLGGNASLALGTPGTPTLSASGTAATLPAVICAPTFGSSTKTTSLNSDCAWSEMPTVARSLSTRTHSCEAA